MPKKKEKNLVVTWKRSTIGRSKDQKATIAALGFNRLNQTLVVPNNPVIQGMIKKVEHLVEVTEE
ncbi:MAG TPA: 50S ribosomal protein L30 [Firmicutes bacterium]|uniref:Large ribosomal subunit protein uL30 n=1 Tax=Capillibacterium thermochitinicola TaxID=2699427 RepID=A0A8J6I1F1_9FIRM|nr:50S ribosomal protein L30 [Capillibacterium thermochitinicola]MBA2132554.1 50S ribosomal protein L30 [Capillibacterium thermochitinicola]HHW11555.1 50S ribosomal protein L30 [Bacillota bacterium]